MTRRSIATALAVFFFSISATSTVSAVESPDPIAEFAKQDDDTLPLEGTQGVQATKQLSPEKASGMLRYAISLLEMPYRMGGKSIETGFDCSGFVAHVFKRALGLNLTGNAATMGNMGAAVKRQDLKIGDLVFFNTMNRPLSHVGIYIGDGLFVHAANKRKGVRIDMLNDWYYASRYDGARALLP